jgi:hypothetical protein
MRLRSICILVLLALAAASGAREAPSLAGTWQGEAAEGALEVRFEPGGELRIGPTSGRWSINGATLILQAAGRMHIYEHRLQGDRLHLRGPLFPEGVDLVRVVAGRPAPEATPVPDAELHSPDAPRLQSPDGRASFIVPSGMESEWLERSGYGELLLRSPASPRLRFSVRIGRIDATQARRDMRELLTGLMGELGPGFPALRPAAQPEQGRLWRWPARSVQLETTDPARSQRGWTALARAGSWYVHLVLLAPRDEAPGWIRIAREAFHDLRIRPGERSREAELQLSGVWEPEASTPESTERLWFGTAENFRWVGRSPELRGRYQVRGPALVLRSDAVEKELHLRQVPAADGVRRVSLSGRLFRRIGPGPLEPALEKLQDAEPLEMAP